eukprot:TRINITY_DN6269_c0_g1_i1.p1 TRINITY_DN6269_c0_g1~~TRINITY_DN6269_c0_g1_i1.p1  ORF type:complete len:762 (-),score=202.44 TRINITY_DN6269_c0_g1_i1:53-2338(-)
MDSYQALGLCVEALYFKVEIIFPNKQTQIYDASTKVTVDRLKAQALQSEHAVGLSYHDYLLGVTEQELLEVEFVKFYDSSLRIREALVVDDLVRIGIFKRDANIGTKEKIDLQTEIHFAEKRSVVEASMNKTPMARLASAGSSDSIDKITKEKKKEEKDAAKSAEKAEKAAQKAAEKAAKHSSSPPGSIEALKAKPKKLSLLNLNINIGGSPSLSQKVPTSPTLTTSPSPPPLISPAASSSPLLVPNSSSFLKTHSQTTSYSSPAILSPTLLSSPTTPSPLSSGHTTPTLHRRQSSSPATTGGESMMASASGPPSPNANPKRMTLTMSRLSIAQPNEMSSHVHQHLSLKRIPEERKERRLSSSVGGVAAGSPTLTTTNEGHTLPPLISPDVKNFSVEAGPAYVPPTFPEHCHIPVMTSTSIHERYPLAEAILTANDPWYNSYFFGKEHTNYLVKPKEDDFSGPALISALMNDTDGSYRVLIRTKRADLKFCTTTLKNAKKGKQKKLPIKDIIKEVYPPMAGKKAGTIKNAKEDVPGLLKYFEDKQIIRSFKFGVLYCAAGQTEEEQMFSNQHGSADWNEFLSVLGEKIQLQGWTKYRAGLDVKTGATGTHSLYTMCRGFEIMFHVSTFLPHDSINPQQLERKRHIGNDIIVVVFKEGDQPYDPNCIKSEFNHIFIVIQKLNLPNSNGKTYYRVSIATKDGVPAFEPELPAAGIFEKSEIMHEFMLAKLINGENASYHSPAFQMKIQRTRLALLKDIESKVS